MSAAQPRSSARWPPVSVVVPTRHRPALLERAVCSVLSQRYPGDLKCVVVFDQSPLTGIAVEAPPGRRLRLMTNTRTPGLAGARNTGMLASTSVFVAFCDDDDEWAPDKLRLQVELLGSTPAVLAGTGVRIHYANRVATRLPPSSVEFRELIRSRVAALHASTFVVRRDALDRIGLVDENIPGSYGEDYEWLLRASRQAPIVSVARPLVDVHWHPRSFFAERWTQIAEALEYLLEKHPELRNDPVGQARIQGQIAFAQAALAHRKAARQASWLAIRSNPLERRAYLALAVAAGAIPAASIVRLANRRGHGI